MKMTEPVRIKVPHSKRLHRILNSKKPFMFATDGRGTGKSTDAAMWLLIKTFNSNGVSACIRETNTSIRDSVGQDLRNAAEILNISEVFDFGQREITNLVTNHRIIFRGLSDSHGTADRIKSLSTIKHAWIEEGHFITKNSLSLLIPTFREEGFQAVITSNPKDPSDPIKIFQDETLEDDIGLLVTYKNVTENPFASEFLLSQYHNSKKRAEVSGDWSDHDYIWEGEYLTSSNELVFPNPNHFKIKDF